MFAYLRDRDRQSLSAYTRAYDIAGKEIVFETGKLALIAHGSAVIRDTAGNYLLTTVGINEKANPNAEYFPLLVEFQEKFYATGKIGGNRFMKREGRPSETAVLNSRLIDRPIRPMFPYGTTNDVQIISTILSSSGVSDYGFYGITGASLALALAGVVEFEGPVSGARVAYTHRGEFIFDPTMEDLKDAIFDLVLAGTEDAITMVEFQGREVEESLILQGMEYGHGIIRDICRAQTDFVSGFAREHPIVEIRLAVKEKNKDLFACVSAFLTDEHIESLYHRAKIEFHYKLHELEVASMEHVRATYGADTEISEKVVGEIVYGVVKERMRARLLREHVRLDGRRPDEVRPIGSEVGILPRTHGSALFERGITQALSVTTLGGPGDIQIVDDLYEESLKRYIHHYNFPPFSVAEVKPLRGVGRREIGHGRLAEKALEPVLPAQEDFPYFIRVVSEITTCNGSSSMASVCGSSLSLMDAGVPIRAMVAGIAMGMIYDESTKAYQILTDIQAQEDFLGDMDFKVARTEHGITALQMDCKIHGLSLAVIGEVFAQAKVALSHIRAEMTKSLASPRPKLSPYAPLIMSIRIPVDRIREVIGKGGEVVQKITRDFKVEVDIKDDGFITVTSKNQESGEGAIAFIRELLREPEVGDIERGRILKIIDGTGAIVDLGSGKSGMIHISKITKKARVTNITDYVNTGDDVTVTIINIDREKGRIGLERIEE